MIIKEMRREGLASRDSGWPGYTRKLVEAIENDELRLCPRAQKGAIECRRIAQKQVTRASYEEGRGIPCKSGVDR